LVSVQYHDEGLESFPQVENDKQLMDMFEKYNETKVVCIFVLYSDPTEPPPLVTEWLDTSPEKEAPDVAAVPSQSEQNQPFQSQPSSAMQPEQDPNEENYLANPLPDNEHMGVDEESLYLGNEIVVVVTVENDANDNGKDKVPEDDDEFDFETESELESDLEELAAKDREPENISNVDYDKNDPPLKVGTIYPNIAEFKAAQTKLRFSHLSTQLEKHKKLLMLLPPQLR
jgi:hypothetical protein